MNVLVVLFEFAQWIVRQSVIKKVDILYISCNCVRLDANGCFHEFPSYLNNNMDPWYPLAALSSAQSSNAQSLNQTAV